MKCPECGAKLDSTETFWDCPECGYFKVKSKYARLEAANERFLKKRGGVTAVTPPLYCWVGRFYLIDTFLPLMM